MATSAWKQVPRMNYRGRDTLAKTHRLAQWNQGACGPLGFISLRKALFRPFDAPGIVCKKDVILIQRKAGHGGLRNQRFTKGVAATLLAGNARQFRSKVNAPTRSQKPAASNPSFAPSNENTKTT